MSDSYNHSFNILEICSHLGEKIVSPSDLFSDDDGRISEKTGIKKLNRSQYSAFELAISALKKSKMLANIASEIQYVIYVTQSPTNFFRSVKFINVQNKIQTPGLEILSYYVT